MLSGHEREREREREKESERERERERERVRESEREREREREIERERERERERESEREREREASEAEQMLCLERLQYTLVQLNKENVIEHSSSRTSVQKVSRLPSLTGQLGEHGRTIAHCLHAHTLVCECNVCER